ncbi:hypothetical protein [Hyunsoonleella aestuarii]|uniref:Uncharacterized protein n=1 Tax=Hyunsoonleella aestuarii TaxID=912802 RepID=A0ABP8E7T7_9FLAO|nr:hypothetical protein [Hyunsoonleella aestuarii]
MIDEYLSNNRLDRIKISFGKPFHIFIEEKIFSNINSYDRFLNWVSGEFELNLQDNTDGLKVFFPNERLSVSKLDSNGVNIIAEIKVEAKIINKTFKLIHKLDAIYNGVILDE